MSTSSDTRVSSSPSAGIAIQVFGKANIGSRAHLEDVLGIELQRARGQAFVAVFDGHGGKDAAQYAEKELWSNISTADGFNSSDSEDIKEAICQGFLDTHDGMWSARSTWECIYPNRLSNAGTTASVVMFRQDRMFVANVGDSTVVLGADPLFIEDCDSTTVNSATALGLAEERERVKAVVLTDDHKPESDKETKRIEGIGGQVVRSRKGVMRVAWLRKREIKFETSICVVPVLNIARSLGDLWSHTEQHNDYFVSPMPDVSEYKLDIRRDKFVVIASDGLWNAMTPQKVINFVHTLREKELAENPQMRTSRVAHALVLAARKAWRAKSQAADNISVMVVFFRAASIMSISSNDSEEDGMSTSLRGLGSKRGDCIDFSDPVNLQSFDREAASYNFADLEGDITTTEFVQTSALLLPSEKDKRDDAQIMNADDNGKTLLLPSNHVTDSDSDDTSPAYATALMSHPVSTISKLRGGMFTFGGHLGKRKSAAMSHGHYCPIIVPRHVKRSGYNETDQQQSLDISL